MSEATTIDFSFRTSLTSGLFTNLCFLPRSSKCGGMATHAGLAIELGITRKKGLSPQMEAILIWCQCRTREYDNVNITVRTTKKIFVG